LLPYLGGSGVVATELGLELAAMAMKFISYIQSARSFGIVKPNVHYHEVNVPEYPLFLYQPYELAVE
jgi:hypothetical protein